MINLLLFPVCRMRLFLNHDLLVGGMLNRVHLLLYFVQMSQNIFYQTFLFASIIMTTKKCDHLYSYTIYQINFQTKYLAHVVKIFTIFQNKYLGNIFIKYLFRLLYVKGAVKMAFYLFKRKTSKGLFYQRSLE